MIHSSSQHGRINTKASFVFLRLSALITTIKVVFLVVRFRNLYHTFLIYFIDNSNILKLMGFKNNRCKNFPSRFNSKAHLQCSLTHIAVFELISMWINIYIVRHNKSSKFCEDNMCHMLERDRPVVSVMSLRYFIPES